LNAPLSRTVASPAPEAKRPVLTLLRSSAVTSALTFAAGGAGFALGNILLARVLPPDEYGAVALLLALTQLGSDLGPLGLELLINRHRLGASRALLGRAALTSALAAAAFAVYAISVYALSASLVSVLAIAILFASLNRVAGAFFQSRQQFALSLFLTQVPNWILLCAVPVVLLLHRPDALPALLTTMAGYLVMASIGWRKSFQERHAEGAPLSSRTLLVEGSAAMGTQVALSGLYQIDRLLIPKLLSIHELADYSIVAALAASPFRMLQTGLAYSLLPRLRACPTREATRLLLRKEAIIALAMGLLAAVGVFVITPWILAELLDNRYAFTPQLLVAFAVVGFVRLWDGIARAVLTALGSARDLYLLNICGWAALGISILSAILLAGSGLTGIVYGVGAGWLTLAVISTAFGRRATEAHFSKITTTAAPAEPVHSH
jgi:O-antigen/teichoic acid export membrane protein